MDKYKNKPLIIVYMGPKPLNITLTPGSYHISGSYTVSYPNSTRNEIEVMNQIYEQSLLNEQFMIIGFSTWINDDVKFPVFLIDLLNFPQCVNHLINQSKLNTDEFTRRMIVFMVDKNGIVSEKWYPQLTTKIIKDYFNIDITI